MDELNTLYLSFDGSLTKVDRKAIIHLLTVSCQCVIEDPKIHRFRKHPAQITEEYGYSYTYSLVLRTPVHKYCDIIYRLVLEQYFKAIKRLVIYSVNNSYELVESAEEDPKAE